MQVGMQGGSALDFLDYHFFFHPRWVGMGKDCLFLFLGVVAPPRYLVLVLIQIKRREVLKFLLLV